MVPTIVLHARDDKVVNYEHAAFYQEHMTGSQLITFESSGHGMVPQLRDIKEHINVFLEKAFHCNEPI